MTAVLQQLLASNQQPRDRGSADMPGKHLRSPAGATATAAAAAANPATSACCPAPGGLYRRGPVGPVGRRGHGRSAAASTARRKSAGCDLRGRQSHRKAGGRLMARN